MGKTGEPNEKTPGGLAPDDAELWRRVSRTAEPLRKGKNRAVSSPVPPEERAQPSHTAESAPKKKPRSPAAARQPKLPEPPSLGSIEKREIRSLGGGRVGVDARIDLHGARQLEAHRLLKSFLAGAQERGHRYVLVITGKGSRGGGDGGAPGRGILNREVPRWLSEPEFRQFVVSFAPAHKRHGGEGALYVRVRRRKPPEAS